MISHDIDYNAVRDCAINLLLSLDIKSYPVNPAQICSKMGWELITLKEYALLCGASVESLRQDLFLGCDAYTFHSKKSNRFKIVYDKKPGTFCRSNFTIAHEIGHIVLGHHSKAEKGTDCLSISQDERFEHEADWFSGSLLAQPVILNALNIENAAQIEHICRLSKAASNSRIKALNRWRSYGFCSKLEYDLLAAFSDYIKSMEDFKNTLHGEILGF